VVASETATESDTNARRVANGRVSADVPDVQRGKGGESSEKRGGETNCLVNQKQSEHISCHMAWKRSVVLSVTAATSQTIQIPVSGKLTRVLMSIVTAAAGTWEQS
jgi:hypothetical protein